MNKIFGINLDNLFIQNSTISMKKNLLFEINILDKRNPVITKNIFTAPDLNIVESICDKNTIIMATPLNESIC